LRKISAQKLLKNAQFLSISAQKARTFANFSQFLLTFTPFFHSRMTPALNHPLFQPQKPTFTGKFLKNPQIQ